MSSSDETVSYSEEEVDVAEQQEALQVILDENEAIGETEVAVSDQNKVDVTSRGKEKKPKVQEEHDFAKVLSDIQNDLNHLKRTGGLREKTKNPKKLKISTKSSTAYQKPTCSKVKKLSDESQLSSATKAQLSSATKTQLSSATKTQLSSATKAQLSSANDQQLSPATKKPRISSVIVKPTQGGGSLRDESTDELSCSGQESDVEEVEVDLGNQVPNDPLQQEVQQIQNPVESEESIMDGDDQSEEEPANLFEEMVDQIDIRADEDIPGPALVKSWAEKLNLAWKTKLPKVAQANLLQKYRTPSNLTDWNIPKMNKEIWRLCDKYQRKQDLNSAQAQRCLIKAATAVLNLHDKFSMMPRAVRQIAMQTTADVVSLLGTVNQEIISRRKAVTRPNLKGDFKYLSSSTKTTENLFGDNLTQDIKDIQVKRKIENPYMGYRQGNRRGQYRGRGGYNNNNNSAYFLGRGRGRGRYNRASHHNNNSNNYNKQQSQHKD